jgi:hypothetical protein
MADEKKTTIGDDLSLLAAAAKVEELLATHPRATEKARFEMFSDWLEDSLERRRAIAAYFVANHLRKQ